MKRLAYLIAFVAGAGVALAFILIVVHGCAQPALTASASSCESDMAEQVMQAQTCTEAQLRVDVLLRYSKTCRDLYGDAGVDVCAILRARKDGSDAGRNTHD